jgi:Cu-processing system ATP-binding protein
MIEIKSLHKYYKKNHVLKGIDVVFESKGIIAVLGPNGSGKTTLLKSILGLVIPDEGDIFFNNRSIKGEFEYRKSISYLSQITKFPDNLTIIELVQLMKDIKPGETREEMLIEMFNLRTELEKKIGNLSGGTRQKVNILLALMHNDPVMILDEPSTGLDPLSLLKFKAFILQESRQGKLIILTTHIMNLAEELASNVLFLLEGEIYFNGLTSALISNEKEYNLESAIAHILSLSREYIC